MNISTTKKMVLGTTVGLAALMAMLAPASAHRRHHHHGHHHHHHFRHWHGPAYVTYGYNSCDYFYRKWKYTGSGYWKYKYSACID